MNIDLHGALDGTSLELRGAIVPSKSLESAKCEVGFAQGILFRHAVWQSEAVRSGSADGKKTVRRSDETPTGSRPELDILQRATFKLAQCIWQQMARGDTPKNMSTAGKPLRIDPPATHDPFWTETSLEEPARTQGVAVPQDIERPFGAGQELWTDEEDLQRFVSEITERRKTEGNQSRDDS